MTFLDRFKKRPTEKAFEWIPSGKKPKAQKPAPSAELSTADFEAEEAKKEKRAKMKTYARRAGVLTTAAAAGLAIGNAVKFNERAEHEHKEQSSVGDPARAGVPETVIIDQKSYGAENLRLNRKVAQLEQQIEQAQKAKDEAEEKTEIGRLKKELAARELELLDLKNKTFIEGKVYEAKKEEVDKLNAQVNTHLATIKSLRSTINDLTREQERLKNREKDLQERPTVEDLRIAHERADRAERDLKASEEEVQKQVEHIRDLETRPGSEKEQDLQRSLDQLKERYRNLEQERNAARQEADQLRKRLDTSPGSTPLPKEVPTPKSPPDILPGPRDPEPKKAEPPPKRDETTPVPKKFPKKELVKPWELE